MTYQDALRDAFETNLIKRIAIVDDGYDPPRSAALGRQALDDFAVAVEDAIVDGDEEGVAAQLKTWEIASLEDVAQRFREDDGLLQRLWRGYRASERGSAVERLLRPLFLQYGVDREDKLRQLQDLEALIEEASGIRPETFDGQARPSDLVEFELIFLDFYLEVPSAPADDVSQDRSASEVEGRARSIEFLKALIAASPKRVPLVMLISSAASGDDIPEFRKQADILASAVQFLPKKHVSLDKFRAQSVLLGLVGRRREVDALWELLDLWKNSVEAATKDLMLVVRELDLADYGYLQEYRLNNEKVPLARYLVWLFNGYLSSLVEESLHKVTATKLVGSIALKGDGPGRMAPTAAISKLYSAITTSKIPTRTEDFAPKAWSGDIFLAADAHARIEGATPPADATDRASLPMPELFGVLTPACDLVPGRSDKLRSVMAIGGRLEPLNAVSAPSPHFILLNDRPFHITWDPKWPVTIPVEALDGGTALEGRYRWVGRLRDLYHAELQHTLLRDVGRVGLPVVPTMPQHLAIRALVQRADRSFEEILHRPLGDACAWTLFSSKDGDRVCHIREDVVWELRDRVLEQHGSATDKQSRKLVEKVGMETFVTTLQRPVSLKKDKMEFGDIGLSVRKVAAFDPKVAESCQHPVLIVLSEETISRAAPVEVG